ncbi:MAG: GNAT family N-acetyltransferase [Bdellovibrionales bacterium]
MTSWTHSSRDCRNKNDLSTLDIRPLTARDLPAVKAFTDQEIGAGYYSAVELEQILKQSDFNGAMCSMVLTDSKGELFGIRISYPPGQWERGKGQGLDPEKWPHPLAKTAYFQSIFLSSQLRGGGWGARLSQASLEVLKAIGAKGVVCHSWMESPNNSSTRYLTKLGFKPVGEHPHYWYNVDYNCTRCLKPPCVCTAMEMYLDLEEI